MVIFHSYVSLPEGSSPGFLWTPPWIAELVPEHTHTHAHMYIYRYRYIYIYICCTYIYIYRFLICFYFLYVILPAYIFTCLHSAYMYNVCIYMCIFMYIYIYYADTLWQSNVSMEQWHITCPSRLCRQIGLILVPWCSLLFPHIRWLNSHVLSPFSHETTTVVPLKPPMISPSNPH